MSLMEGRQSVGPTPAERRNHRRIGSVKNSSSRTASIISRRESSLRATRQSDSHNTSSRLTSPIPSRPEYLTFDSDGDLVLLLIYPPEEQLHSKAEEQNDTSRDSGSDDSMSTMGEEAAMSTACLSSQPKEVQMRVSSHTLMIASPVFKAMLQRNAFKEGVDLATQGGTFVSLPEDDPTMLRILLDIIHHRTRQVPLEVDLKTLTGLSILIDKYQMLEALELYVDMWVEGLQRSLPNSFTTDFLSWLNVAWVLKLPVEFEYLTRIAVRESRGEIGGENRQEPEDLPIPDSILVKIEETREKAISDVLAIFNRYVEKYKGPKVLCGSKVFPRPDEKKMACDSLMLGSLLRSGQVNGLSPNPEVPFSGKRFIDILASLRALKPMAVCDDLLSTFKWDPAPPPPSHGVKASIIAKTQALEDRIIGLDLEDFI
ncbi:hypothetical protein G7Y89_g8872 [Cudoniella acicularis]|uniref:BTB domain-containing protein n=1 Tax=Cudoniella acicularis TaxID=354080 RepID=A0A8H4RI25_9HELO|nr:hypothetical protein G7Y89_g8872 [Cudoniella acicularis]